MCGLKNEFWMKEVHLFINGKYLMTHVFIIIIYIDIIMYAYLAYIALLFKA